MTIHHKKRILVAPLNWGLGHATRCIPIINELIQNNFEPIIASDGAALELLKKEFPNLEAVELPSYNIRYSKNPNRLRLKFLKNAPRLLKIIKKEEKVIRELVNSKSISGIISDNRFGVRHDNIPSVFITHQLQVLSGNTTWLSTKWHQKIISQFDECWIPDYKTEKNLSGILGHVENFKSTVHYLGPLSRFEKHKSNINYQLLVILSGPEPQRTFLEEILFEELKNFKGKICFVKGVIESEQRKIQHNHMTIYNFMTSAQLESTINESELIVSRSGYTTLMDLAKLEKKAFFIPTPGQFEQDYLAKKIESEGIAPYCTQHEFTLEKLNQVEKYSGFKFETFDVKFADLFRLF